MITPEQARRRIAAECAALAPASVALSDAYGCVLAADVESRTDLPPFDNSAMDGFAFRHEDAMRRRAQTGEASLPVAGTVYAGDAVSKLGDGTARRIMTGAPIPRGADTVVPQEDVSVDADMLSFDRMPVAGCHVRRRGEVAKRGDVIARAGDIIHPGTVACLAAAGCATVRVVRMPTVDIVVTGDETRPPGSRLRSGEIYESNGHMLDACVRDAGFPVGRVRTAPDRPALLARKLRDALTTSDVVIVAGGVSVGERDHVRELLSGLGVREVFWRVLQKPGKPLYFGVRGTGRKRRLVFGLPGNPVSAFSCFYLYVYPALLSLSGRPFDHMRGVTISADGVAKRDATKWRFLKARFTDGGAEAVPHQGSHMVTSLAATQGLIELPPEGEDAAARILRLPYADGDE